MKRVVVFGAGGLLGRHLVEELRAAGGFSVVVLARGDCSITDGARVRDMVGGAEWVFNCAAFTDVDGAEKDPAGAFAANALGAEEVARAADAAGALCVHVSTDFVFDGAQARPYDEWDAPNPLSVYARSKRAGEILVEKSAGWHQIVRVQGLYGDGGRNFSSKMRRLFLDGKQGLRIDAERKVQPTWARHAARAMIAIAATGRVGVFHVSGGGAATWSDFAEHLSMRLAKQGGLQKKVSWDAVSSALLTLPAPRPPNCLFSHRRTAMMGLALPTWQQSLDAYLDEMSEKETTR